MANPDMTPLVEAFEIMDRTLQGVILPSETMYVRDAGNRVLCCDQLSRLELPPFNKSAMDGYAVLEGDERDEYKVLETIAAGSAGISSLSPGKAIKVMTGTAIPEGTGKVIKIENTQRHGDMIHVTDHTDSPNICWRADDIKVGQKIAAAGNTIDPLTIGNLISCGIAQVEVARTVRVAIISTGDEIVDSIEDFAPGKIINTNGPLLNALAVEYGFEVVGEYSVPDDKAATNTTLCEALDMADVVIMSGGVSVGDFDFVLDVLEELGLTIHFKRLSVKPGKPTTFASDGRRIVLGLPGNPVAAFLMFHLFVLRAASLISGRQPVYREFRLRIKNSIKRRNTERSEYRPCSILQDGFVEELDYHGSAHLAGLTGADGFFIIPAGVEHLQAGENIAFFPVANLWKW